MQPPTDSVRAELEPLLAANPNRLGQVYRVLDRGWPDHRIAAELGVETSGFVANYRTIVRALLEGREPRGPRSADQVASAVRSLVKNARLSQEASSYIDRLLSVLAAIGGTEPVRRGGALRNDSAAAPTAQGNLRMTLDREVKERLSGVIDRLRGIGIDADDYQAAMSADFALDVLVRLAAGGPMSRTSRELVERGRLDLSIEQAVVDWASDLPLTTSLVEDAQGRLDYWRSQ